MEKRKDFPLEIGWRLVLADMGLAGENVLRRAGLPEDLLGQENIRLTGDEYSRFWDAVDLESGDTNVPLRIVETVSTEAFDPAIFAALCSPNLKVAMRRIAEHKRLVAPKRIILEEDETRLYIGMEWEDPSFVSPIPLAVTELTFTVHLARIGTRERIRPLKIESPYPMEPTADYENYFGTVPERSSRHGVTFRASDARKPFLTASDALWASFEPNLRRRLAELTATATSADRVRSALLEGLPSGQASIQHTAKRLGVSARTLQRSLNQEGTSYKETVKEIRERLSLHYVTNTKLPFAEISFLIGYEEPSSFFRAFREWTGLTPEVVRLSRSNSPLTS
ncbi:MAG: AraC family transcriptional regulator ligand-binding domain-containing protein [Verrucomicrobiota bacterium]